jgi:hypothetical protein
MADYTQDAKYLTVRLNATQALLQAVSSVEAELFPRSAVSSK